MNNFLKSETDFSFQKIRKIKKLSFFAKLQEEKQNQR